MEELRPHGHEDQTPNSGRGEEEDVHSSHHHPPEKIKSVLKKVKDKAKKIKNTLTKHGHDDHDMGRKEEEDGDNDDIEDREFEKQSDHPPVSSVAKPFEDRENKLSKLRRESMVKEDPNSPKSNLLPSNYKSKDSTEMEVGREAGIPSMGIHGGDGIKEEDNQTKSPDLLTNQKPNKEIAPSYPDKISSAASTLFDKAIAVASNLRESGEKKVAILMSGKMSPGEEDKALSETISNALEWRKKGDEKEEGEIKKKVMGEVKVSDELAKRLGSTSMDDGSSRSRSVEEVEEEGRLPGVSESMVEKIKETVGSWFGIRAGADQSQASSVGTTTIGGSGNAEETKGTTNG